MDLKKFRRSLLKWYQKHKRDLPWRQTQDPYKIWVSEIMLQQTQVVTVIPYYEKFIKRFSTLRKLAAASEEEVLSLWSGLGYYRRAKLLHRGAQTVLQQFRGKIPQNVQQLKTLPSIGDYTAGAIASIAFNQPAPLVDGNVIRVLSRVFAIKGHAQEAKLQKRIWSLTEDLVVGKAPGDFNQALMELGATVCRVRVPSCERCVLRAQCLAWHSGKPEQYPETPPSTKTVRLYRAVAIGEKAGKILLVKRKKPRWFQGMWELPHDYVEALEGAQKNLSDFLQDSLGVQLKDTKEIPRTSHAITHHRITSLAWKGNLKGRLKLNGIFDSVEFFSPQEILKGALPNFDRKVLQAAESIHNE